MTLGRDRQDDMDYSDECYLEESIGLRSAVLALWSPADEPSDVELGDERLIQRSRQTRRRLVAVHLITSGLLSENFVSASAELDRLGPVGLVLTATRATLASRQHMDDDSAGCPDIDAIIECSRIFAESMKRQCLSAMSTDLEYGVDAALNFLGIYFREGSHTSSPILPRICDLATSRPKARYSICCALCSGYAAALALCSPTRSPRELAEEQAALALAYVTATSVRWSNRRIIVSE